MWSKIIVNLARKMVTTKSGHKFLKGLLIGSVFLLIVTPGALFEPIAGLVNGLSSFYSGEEGDDLDDSSDLDALIQGTLVISETKYYKQIMKIRAKHIKKIEEEQEKLEDMAKEIKAAAEPLRRFLEKYYDPTVEVVVDTGVVTVKRGEYMTIFQKEEVPEENE